MPPPDAVQENVYGAVPAAGVTVIPPSSDSKQVLFDMFAEAVSSVGSVTSADAVAVHPVPPLLLSASVILNV